MVKTIDIKPHLLSLTSKIILCVQKNPGTLLKGIRESLTNPYTGKMVDFNMVSIIVHSLVEENICIINKKNIREKHIKLTKKGEDLAKNLKKIELILK